jgi:hypothetical protein
MYKKINRKKETKAQQGTLSLDSAAILPCLILMIICL